MQKQINKFITKMMGGGIEPERVLFEIGKSTFYFGLGMMLTALALLNKAWVLGFALFIGGFLIEAYYSNKIMRNASKKIKKTKEHKKK